MAKEDTPPEGSIASTGDAAYAHAETQTNVSFTTTPGETFFSSTTPYPYPGFQQSSSTHSQTSTPAPSQVLQTWTQPSPTQESPSTLANSEAPPTQMPPSSAQESPPTFADPEAFQTEIHAQTRTQPSPPLTCHLTLAHFEVNHANCNHLYNPATGQDLNDRIVVTPFPHPSGQQTWIIALHPRWCKSCAGSRIHTIMGITQQALLEIGAEYPPMEEEVFNHGIRCGRRAAVCLDPNMDRHYALQAVIDFIPTAPFNPFDLQNIFRPILQGSPEMDYMLAIWDNCRARGLNLQRKASDMDTIEQIMVMAYLSNEQKKLVRGMVKRFHEGQTKGLYWQWQLEARAFAAHSDRRDVLFQEALTRKMPRSGLT